MALAQYILCVNALFMSGVFCGHHHEVAHEIITSCAGKVCDARHPTCWLHFHGGNIVGGECIPAHDCDPLCSATVSGQSCCCNTNACVTQTLQGNVIARPAGHHHEVAHELITSCADKVCDARHPTCWLHFHGGNMVEGECIPTHVCMIQPEIISITSDCDPLCSATVSGQSCCCNTNACVTQSLQGYVIARPAGHHHEIAHEDVINCPGHHCEGRHPSCLLTGRNGHVSGVCIEVHECSVVCDVQTYESTYSCCCPMKNCVQKKLSLHAEAIKTTTSTISSETPKPIVQTDSPATVHCSTCTDVFNSKCSEIASPCTAGEVCMLHVSNSLISSRCEQSAVCLNAQIQDLFSNTKTQCCTDSACEMTFLSHATQIIEFLSRPSTTVTSMPPQVDVVTTMSTMANHMSTTTTTPRPTTTTTPIPTTTTSPRPTTELEAATTVMILPLSEESTTVASSDIMTTTSVCADVDAAACQEFDQIYNICQPTNGQSSQVAMNQCPKTCNLCN